MNTRHTKAAPSKAKKNLTNKSSASNKASNKTNDLKTTKNIKNNVTNKAPNKKETAGVKPKPKPSLAPKKDGPKATKNDLKTNMKATASTSTTKATTTTATTNNKSKAKAKLTAGKKIDKINNDKDTKTAKAKPIKKAALKKNSIAIRRKTRVASLDASAKMKIMTESDSRKVEVNKDDTNKLKKDIKEEAPDEESKAATIVQARNKSPKPNSSKNSNNDDTKKKKTDKMTNNKAPEKGKKVTKKTAFKNKIIKKKAPIRKRNELGDIKAEIFDTKVYKRIASLNATAIMAATSITATSMAGKKPLDDSSDSDSENESLPAQPITPKTPATTSKTKVQNSVPPSIVGDSSAFTTVKSVPTPKGNKKPNTSKKSFDNNSMSVQQNENGVKVSPKGKPATGASGSTQNRKLEDLSSPKSAFSPCSPVREPEIIRIEIGPPASSTGSSRTDGNTIKVPKPKKIKVQTIHLDSVKKETNIGSSGSSSSNIPSGSRHGHSNVNHTSHIGPGGSAFAQPAPAAPSSTHQIPVMQNNPTYFSNCFPGLHHPQPNPALSMSLPGNFIQYPQYVPFSLPVMMQPYGFASHLAPQPPPQPALMSTPFPFSRPQTSSYGPNPFLFSNGHDPTSMMFRQQPSIFQHSTMNAHHAHHAHAQPMPRFSTGPIFPMSGGGMHVNMSHSGPSTTTSVTIEEIHDESGENEDVTIIPIVVQAPSDDDRSSLPSGSPRKKTEKYTKTKSKVINGSSSSKSTSNLNGIVHASPNVVTNCIDIDQFEGNRTASNIATKTIHLPVNGNSTKRANHPQSPVPPSTAKKKAANKDPNVIEIVLDDPNTIIHKPNDPKNGSDRAIAAVILNNKKDKRIYHGWSWQGEPFYKEVFINNDEKCTQKCFPAIRHLEGDVIRVRDCVLLKSGTRKNDLPFVAKIAALWQSAGDEMNMSLLWYYRPEQVDVKCDAMPGEIFASRHKDVNSVACIEDKCFVLTYNQWCRYKAIRRRFLNQLLIRPPAQESLDLKGHSKLPPINTEPEMVFFSSRVYDYRQKRILKSG